jgi:hypothetical protein
MGTEKSKIRVVGRLVDLPDPLSRRNGSDTEKKAAQGAKKGQSKALLQVLEGLNAYGPMTNDEGAAATGVKITTYSTRRSELVRLGLARDTGIRRPSESGFASAVVEITEAGIEALRAGIEFRRQKQ